MHSVLPSPLQEEKETLQSQAHYHSHWETGGGKQVRKCSCLLSSPLVVFSLRALDNQIPHLWSHGRSQCTVQLWVPEYSFVLHSLSLRRHQKAKEWAKFSLRCTVVYPILALICESQALSFSYVGTSEGQPVDSTCPVSSLKFYFSAPWHRKSRSCQGLGCEREDQRADSQKA